jgi:hypothetical protein
VTGERSGVSEDARSCNILDEAALRVQGCDAKQEPSVKSQVERVRGREDLYLPTPQYVSD